MYAVSRERIIAIYLSDLLFDLHRSKAVILGKTCYNDKLTL